MRTLAPLVLLLVLALGGLACVPGEDNPGSGAGAVRLVRAPIDELDVLVRESSPPGYTLHIVSGLPSGCAHFDSARITERVGTVVTVEVLNSEPADNQMACTMIYGMQETNLDLGTDFHSGQEYTVKVNDEERTFVAQ